MPEFSEYLDGLDALPTDPKSGDKMPVMREGSMYTIDPVSIRTGVLQAPPPTLPIQALTAPQFAASGATLKQGVPVVRVAGSYSAGTITQRYRTRGSGIETTVSNGGDASYTPVSDDVGEMMTYYETVTNSVTGEVKTFASEKVGPILPPDPTEPGEVEDFDFTSGTAHAVTVVRAGNTATRRTGAATVAVMAANTKRYEFNASGTQIGLLCEKAATNFFPNADDVSSAVTATDGATKTSNYGTAPDGSTSSTRIVATAGGASRGVTVGITPLVSATLQSLWIKGTAGQEYVISDSDSGSYIYRGPTTGAWQLIEDQGTAAPGSNYLNWRVLNNGFDALDVEVWGVALQPGTGYQTMILTSGVSLTRPKEVWTVTLATGSVTRDIQIEDHLGQVQNFTEQIIGPSKEWELDADDVTISPVIAKLRVYSDGTLDEASPPSAPPPPPPPSSSDYPTMTMAQLIDFMESPDDATNGGFTLPARQASIQSPINYAGVQYLSEYPRTDGLGSSNFYQLWHALAFWVWLFLGNGHTATGKRIQVRRMTSFVLLDSALGDWYTGPVRDVGGPGQTALWKANVDQRSAPPASWMRSEPTGGYSITLSDDYGVEMWANPGFYALADRSIMVRAFSGAGVFEIRVINEDGTPYYGSDAKPLVRLGGDLYASALPSPTISPYIPRGADGFMGRYKIIDTTNVATEGWAPVGFVTCDFAYKKDGPRRPWGNYTGSWAITGSTYNLTKAQLQANPPPFVSG